VRLMRRHGAWHGGAAAAREATRLTGGVIFSTQCMRWTILMATEISDLSHRRLEYSPRRAAAFTRGTSEVWAPKPSKCHAVVIYCVNRPNSSAVLVRVRAVTLSLAYRYLRCSESIRTGAQF
jgi:hypothetical protein